jgi:hypothetical protein
MIRPNGTHAPLAVTTFELDGQRTGDRRALNETRASGVKPDRALPGLAAGPEPMDQRCGLGKGTRLEAMAKAQGHRHSSTWYRADWRPR